VTVLEIATMTAIGQRKIIKKLLDSKKKEGAAKS